MTEELERDVAALDQDGRDRLRAALLLYMTVPAATAHSACALYGIRQGDFIEILEKVVIAVNWEGAPWGSEEENLCAAIVDEWFEPRG